MTPEQFCYWLQGFAEIHQMQPTGQEWVIIMDHLAKVFDKQTPSREKEYDMADAIKTLKKQTPDFGRWPIDIDPGKIIC